MRILEAGTRPGERIWTGSCQKCNTVFSARQDELKKITHEDQRNGGVYAHVDCTFCDAKAPGAVVLHMTKDVDTADEPRNDTDVVARIRDAVQGYYAALTAREHGQVAQDRAFHKIERVLGMSWHK